MHLPSFGKKNNGRSRDVVLVDKGRRDVIPIDCCAPRITGLQLGLGENVRGIVKTAAYEINARDVSSQVAALRNSGADLLLIAATPNFATQALAAVGGLLWKVPTYLTSVSASREVMRTASRQEGRAAATDGRSLQGTRSIKRLRRTPRRRE